MCKSIVFFVTFLNFFVIVEVTLLFISFIMKYLLTGCIALMLLTSSLQADFMYEEIDPICSISWTTHTSFPGEISDTSSWYIPKAYDGECIETPEISQNEKDRIYEIMTNFFEKKDLMNQPGNTDDYYNNENALNQVGREFMMNTFFPAVVSFIADKESKNQADSKDVAILNYAVKIIWYDYFISQPE